MLISHIRSRLQFYLLLASVVNTIAYMYYFSVMPPLVVFALCLVQLFVVFRSVAQAIVHQWGYFGLGLAVFHVIVFAVYFDRLMYNAFESIR